MHKLLLPLALAMLFSLPVHADVKVSALFGDHMVLQRNRADAVWGTAAPGEKISIALRASDAPASVAPLAKAEATADAGGNWITHIGPLRAGGPFVLTVAGANTLTLNDVLVGDVWLCSGQSNMEFQMSRVQDADKELAKAVNPNLRLFHVGKNAQSAPQRDLGGAWAPCSPDAVKDFSAVAYYMGNELQGELKVPVGLIDSSWGGSPIMAWLGRDTLTGDPVLKHLVTEVDAGDRVNTDEWTKRFNAWNALATAKDAGNGGEAKGFARADFDDRAWPTLNLPGSWETDGPKVDGAVWLRRTVEVPAALAGHDLTLELGPITDFDTAYFNGVQVGATDASVKDAASIARKYTVAAKLVHAGQNVVAVRAFNQQFDAGFKGGADALKLSRTGDPATVALAGPWKYAVETALDPKRKDLLPALPHNYHFWFQLPSALYNGMIAPLQSYGLKGVAWYQGEQDIADNGYNHTYPGELRDLIGSWRAQFGDAKLPFLVVQLPNVNDRQSWAQLSGPFAQLRDAQATVLQIPNTALTVNIDIGAKDIHPPFKAPFGHRLALAALHSAYGRPVVASGPTFDAMSIAGDKVTLRFKNIGAGLTTSDGAAPRGFAIAGATGDFEWADAKIVGDTVVLSKASIANPTRVRYAYQDNPDANLANRDGLPAAPFITKD